MKKQLKTVLALTVAALLLTSCLREAAKVDKNSGIGRDNVPAETKSTDTDKETDSETTRDTETTSDTSETKESGETGYTPPPLDKKDEETTAETASSADGISWKVENGKYTYSFPPRDESGLATLSEMDSTSTALFDDQGDDLTGSWYFGKTSYDEATGEATHSWDRSQTTLDLMNKYGGIYRGDETRKVCYLTFDCGYEYGPTKDILDTLKEKEIGAIFFLTGAYVKSEEDLVRRMIDEGHILGNHTVNHKNMTQVSKETFVDELEGVEDLIKEKFPDAEPLHYWRPPMGACNEWVLKLADKMDYHTVMWSWAYYDYDVNNQPDPADALAKAKNGLHPGVVYLFHTESTTNAAILGDLIDWIRAQGYEILPLCDINVGEK